MSRTRKALTNESKSAGPIREIRYLRTEESDVDNSIDLGNRGSRMHTLKSSPVTGLVSKAYLLSEAPKGKAARRGYLRPGATLTHRTIPSRLSPSYTDAEPMTGSEQDAGFGYVCIVNSDRHILCVHPEADTSGKILTIVEARSRGYQKTPKGHIIADTYVERAMAREHSFRPPRLHPRMQDRPAGSSIRRAESHRAPCQTRQSGSK